MFRRESRGNADRGRGRDHREDEEVRRGLQVQEGGVGWLRPTDDGKFDPILPCRPGWSRNVLITVLLHCQLVPVSPSQFSGHKLQTTKVFKIKNFQLMTREDSLKTKNSAPSCEKMRRITKNCKDKLRKSTKESKFNHFYFFFFLHT